MSPELTLALEAVQEAGDLALKYFTQALTVERKGDDSPVTAADREVEQLLRERLTRRFPDYGVLGEEFGETDRGAETRWIIDPIDGTKSFIFGVPLFANLIGLERRGEPVLGVAHFPALRTTFWAERGEGAYRDGHPISVSDSEDLSRSLIVCGSHAAFEIYERARGFRRLVEQAFATRTWGDAYGHCMVADGRAVAMIDPVVKPYDILPILPIVVEAGGAVTDFSGAAWDYHGEAISTNGKVLPKVVEAFR
ncbi:MAG: histidinol phosphate phosphatase [Fimbriimonadales bacterium]|nr:MAG: histidinol phosphate phosphatase [Fimbriimonadales bacterium]